jgi:hypothetical protein
MAQVTNRSSRCEVRYTKSTADGQQVFSRIQGQLQAALDSLGFWTIDKPEGLFWHDG